MAPTHATKPGIRYRYYVSRPCLHGEARTANVGSVTRVPAADIEDVVLRSLNEHFRNQSGMPATAITGHSAIAEMIDRIDVYEDRLAIRLRSRESPSTTKLADDIEEPTDDRLLSIPWQKPPSKRFRQILLPHGSSRKEVRPERPERRLSLVRAIARGRRWLDEIVSGSVTDAEQIALRERCSVRHVHLARLSCSQARPRCGRGSFASGHQHRAAARCSGGMEWAVRSAWAKSATIARAPKTPALPTAPRSGSRATKSRMSAAELQ
jgi:site-specific DNA recombinase